MKTVNGEYEITTKGYKEQLKKIVYAKLMELQHDGISRRTYRDAMSTALDLPEVKNIFKSLEVNEVSRDKKRVFLLECLCEAIQDNAIGYIV